MKRILVALLVWVAGLTVLSSRAGALDGIYVLQGTVHVEKDSKGEVTAISVKLVDGHTVQVVVDNVSSGMSSLDGYGVAAYGHYTAGRAFKVTSWSRRRPGE